MYVIYKDSKRTFRNYTFASYDSARLFVRKTLRERAKNKNWKDGWMVRLLSLYSNPNLGTFGYSIKKV